MTDSRASLAIGAVVMLAAGAAAAAAGEPAGVSGESGGSPASPERVEPDSPRAALAAFLDLCDAGDWAGAARWLELSRRTVAAGPGFARRLKAVLDRRVTFDLDAVSPLSEGQTDDGLPPGTDRVAAIAGSGGTPEPVLLVRRSRDGAARWLFSRGTVDRIGSWYDDLEDRWIRDYLPEVLSEPGPFNVRWWQWIALPLLFVLAWAVGRFLRWISVGVLRRVVLRTRTRWDDRVLEQIGGPVTLAWALLVVYLALPWLGLPHAAGAFAGRAARAGFLVVLFWAVFRAVGVAGDVLADPARAKTHPGMASIAPLVGRVAKVLVLVIAVIGVLSEFGYPVASILAGLGIGGLALALAAQKTVENVFGSVSIGVDQPFRVGDFVKIDDFVGTVETIGLRSTRLRTLDRTLVTIPNGKLADTRIESYAVRDRIRLSCTIGLVYATTAEQMRAVLGGLEETLRSHPKIWPDSMVVRFKEFGASSLDVEVMAWFRTSDWNEFVAIRQEILLAFMGVVERAGSGFAFPTRTLHVVDDRPAPAGAK